MSKSLQEQLLGAGVANRKQAVKAKKAKNQKVKQRKSGIVTEDETAIKLQQEQEAKAERDRELNRQRDEAAAKKAVLAQIKQIIEHSRLPRPKDSDVRFNFTDDGRIKYLQVTEEQQRHLSRGFLAIVQYDEAYELIPTTAAEKIKSREAGMIVTWNKNAPISEHQDQPDEEDPYADYEIPDDLMW